MGASHESNSCNYSVEILNKKKLLLWSGFYWFLKSTPSLLKIPILTESFTKFKREYFSKLKLMNFFIEFNGNRPFKAERKTLEIRRWVPPNLWTISRLWCSNLVNSSVIVRLVSIELNVHFILFFLTRCMQQREKNLDFFYWFELWKFEHNSYPIAYACMIMYLLIWNLKIRGKAEPLIMGGNDFDPLGNCRLG